MDSETIGWSLIIVIVVAALSINLGLAYAIKDAGAINDKDCEDFNPNPGPHDEVDNPNGCHRECAQGHTWFEIGKHKWCYYNDMDGL